jgi:hypothetical protein
MLMRVLAGVTGGEQMRVRAQILATGDWFVLI